MSGSDWKSSPISRRDSDTGKTLCQCVQQLAQPTRLSLRRPLTGGSPLLFIDKSCNPLVLQCLSLSIRQHLVPLGYVTCSPCP